MPSANLAQLTLLRDIRRRELEVLDARLEEANRAKVEAEVRWHTRMPRSVVPLVATLVAVLAANGAVLAGFGILLAGGREPFFNVLFVVTALTAIAGLPFSGGEGAGGLARPWLRRVAVVFLAISFAEVVYAAS